MATRNIETKYFHLPASNRTLAYAIYGAPLSSLPPSGPSAKTNPIFYFHGYPASHLEALIFHPAALAANTSLIAISRPGLGESTPAPHRILLDWPADVLALADALEIKEFGVLVLSAGTPYAFTCLKEIGRERLRVAGVASGLYPSVLGYAGMQWGQRLQLVATAWLPAWFLAGRMRGPFEMLRAAEAESGDAVEAFLDAEMSDWPECDREVWEKDEGGYRGAMVASVRYMLQGEFAADAAALEAKLFAGSWGFELGEVDVGDGRLIMWHGGRDGNVPVRMAREAVVAMGGEVELRVGEEEGHASLGMRWREGILRTLVKRMSGDSDSS